MKVAEVIVRILEKEGIEVAFGIPGAGINPVYKYLGDSKIKHYNARHEEGAVHAADGYYRSSGKMAVAIATSGPGATNFVTGLYTAQIDSMPLIALTGQNTTSQLGKEAFQCVDIVSIAKPIVKAAYCLTVPNDAPKVMKEAFKLAREGRPGPVLLDLPLDIQQADIDFNIDDYIPATIDKPKPDIQKIDQAIDMILAAKSPVMLIGGGVILAGANNEARRLAEFLSLPIIETYMAKGAVPYDHPLYVGHAGIQVGGPLGNKILSEADLVLGIGCRFTDRHTGDIDVYTKGKKFIHIDIEPTQIGKIFAPDLGIVSDAKLAIEAMLDRLTARHIERQPDYRIEVLPEWRKQYTRKTYFDNIPIKPQRVFHEINEFYDDDTIFTAGCGLVQIWSGQFQRARKPRRYIPSGGAGTLGYELPAVIGAKIANPDSQAVAVVGDGGVLFMIEELAMACHYQIPITVIIVNNGYLSLIRQNQKYAYGFEHAVDLWYNDGTYTDFVKVAEGFGAKGERIFKPEDIKPALQRAKDANCPYVIDVIVERRTDCSMGSSIENVTEYE